MREPPIIYQRKPKAPATQGKRGWLFWSLVIGIPVAVVLYIAMFAGFGYLYVSNVKELPVSQAEWDVVVDAHDVAEWLPDLEVATLQEELAKIRYIDRSYEVSYEYNPDDASVYVSSSLSIERNLSDALTGYLPLWTATLAGFKLSGSDDIEIEALEDFFEWGDQSKMGLIRSGGEPSGHLFVARKGKKIFFLLLSGIYFDDAEMWADFLLPTLNQINQYHPEQPGYNFN